MISFASKCYHLQGLAPTCIVSPNQSMSAINNNGFVCIEVYIK